MCQSDKDTHLHSFNFQKIKKFRFVHILSYIYLSNNHLFFTYPLRELIFGHYILSFSLSYHTSSGITQITFLNASSKSPYKQMQSLTRNNHITSNHLLHCFCSPHQKIYSFVYFPLQLCFPTAM